MWSPIFAIILVFIEFGTPKDASGTVAITPFDYTKEPSTEDWRYFHKLEAHAQEKVWNSFIKKGVKLNDWSWAWRLGWIRACQTNRKDFCNHILVQALGDRAAVVRGEGATALGRLYENSGRKDIIKHLEKSGLDSRNFRNGKPLFVQKRILFAIVGIGGSDAAGSASKIAKTHKELDNYLKKLQHKS
jgi:hypothetical protein